MPPGTSHDIAMLSMYHVSLALRNRSSSWMWTANRGQAQRWSCRCESLVPPRAHISQDGSEGLVWWITLLKLGHWPLALIKLLPIGTLHDADSGHTSASVTQWDLKIFKTNAQRICSSKCLCKQQLQNDESAIPTQQPGFRCIFPIISFFPLRWAGSNQARSTKPNMYSGPSLGLRLRVSITNRMFTDGSRRPQQ